MAPEASGLSTVAYAAVAQNGVLAMGSDSGPVRRARAAGRLRPSAPVGARRLKGSDWARFGSAITRNWAPTPARVPNGVAAGRGLVRPHERRRPQTIALTLSVMCVFPMTHQVECAAPVRVGLGARPDAHPTVGCTGYA